MGTEEDDVVDGRELAAPAEDGSDDRMDPAVRERLGEAPPDPPPDAGASGD